MRPMGTVAYRGKGQGKGKGRGEGRLGQGGRGRSKAGEKLMGTTAYGGKGSKGRAANGDRPVGAASCRRDHHTMASCQNPPCRPSSPRPLSSPAPIPQCLCRTLPTHQVPLCTFISLQVLVKLRLSSIWMLGLVFKTSLGCPHAAAFVEGSPCLSFFCNQTRKFGAEDKNGECWVLLSTDLYGKRNKVPQV